LGRYLHVPHVISCASGTDAILAALMVYGFEPGDEIITSGFTFIAPAEAIALLGLKPVFVDIDPATFAIDTTQLQELITPRTKAIIPVHLFGQSGNMTEIMRIAHHHNLVVIEDNAQSLGASYIFPDASSKKLGTIGDIGCTSFFPSKNLGCCGDGGAIFTNNEELAGKLRCIVNHGSKKKYIHEMVGLNSRLDTIQAAILLIKLEHLDDYIHRRRLAAEYYDQAFSFSQHIIIPARNRFSSHVFNQYTIVLQDSENKELQNYLTEKEIPSMIYYPVPMHLQKIFSKIIPSHIKFPVCDQLSHKVLSLPMHTELDEIQLEYITKTILGFFK